MAQDGVLPNPLPTFVVPIASSYSINTMSRELGPTAPMTLRDTERAFILQALQTTNWRIGGSKGAAIRLGLNRSTLLYRMKKLGIVRPLQRAASPEDFVLPEPAELMSRV